MLIITTPLTVQWSWILIIQKNSLHITEQSAQIHESEFVQLMRRDTRWSTRVPLFYPSVPPLSLWSHLRDSHVARWFVPSAHSHSLLLRYRSLFRSLVLHDTTELVTCFAARVYCGTKLRYSIVVLSNTNCFRLAIKSIGLNWTRVHAFSFIEQNNCSQ